MRKNAIIYINETQAQVTKAFAKNAVIFGTDEFKLWREYRKEFPEATMVTKTIKKNANKRTNKNLTYENMAGYIKVQENAEELMKEFQKEINLSKVQTSPYRHVLAWFEQKFENFDSYKKYFEELKEKDAAENSMFNLATATN